MKIKIIDLLNKIANNEQPPKKIMYDDEIYTYNEYNNLAYCYTTDDDNLFRHIDNINEEVEILETTIVWNRIDDSIEYKTKNITPKKIEKIDMFDYFTGYWYNELPENFTRHLENNFEILNEKINEIIDKINEE